MLILLPEGGGLRLFGDGGGDPNPVAVFRLLAIQVHAARASFIWGNKKKCGGVKSDI